MSGLEAQWRIPAGFDRDGTMLTLEEVFAEGSTAVPTEELSRSQRKELVRARWEAGEWADCQIGRTYVDLDRAVKELEADSTLGADLLEASEYALEIALNFGRKERGA